MKSGITFTLLIFTSGLIFGVGLQGPIVRVAFNYGHEQGAESVVLRAIERDGVIELAEAR